MQGGIEINIYAPMKDGAYACDASELTRVGIIDKFVSFTVTKKLVEYGEFELWVQPDNNVENLLKIGYFIYINSKVPFTAIIESIEKSYSDGALLMKASGRTPELLLTKRTIYPSYGRTDNLNIIINQLVGYNCLSNWEWSQELEWISNYRRRINCLDMTEEFLELPTGKLPPIEIEIPDEEDEPVEPEEDLKY